MPVQALVRDALLLAGLLLDDGMDAEEGELVAALPQDHGTPAGPVHLAECQELVGLQAVTLVDPALQRGLVYALCLERHEAAVAREAAEVVRATLRIQDLA